MNGVMCEFGECSGGKYFPPEQKNIHRKLQSLFLRYYILKAFLIVGK